MQVKQFAVVAIAPLFAGFLLAQQPRTETQTTTTTTTWNGTLIDAGCRSTHSESKETKTDERGTKSTTSRTDTVDCPVAMTTTTFGLLTPDGQYVRFDPSSNTRIVEMMKKNGKWKTEISGHSPVSVRVNGKKEGDVIVLESID